MQSHRVRHILLTSHICNNEPMAITGRDVVFVEEPLVAEEISTVAKVNITTSEIKVSTMAEDAMIIKVHHREDPLASSVAATKTSTQHMIDFK